LQVDEPDILDAGPIHKTFCVNRQRYLVPKRHVVRIVECDTADNFRNPRRRVRIVVLERNSEGLSCSVDHVSQRGVRANLYLDLRKFLKRKLRVSRNLGAADERRVSRTKESYEDSQASEFRRLSESLLYAR
jgi:hypothetical protein